MEQLIIGKLQAGQKIIFHGIFSSQDKGFRIRGLAIKTGVGALYRERSSFSMYMQGPGSSLYLSFVKFEAWRMRRKS